MKQFINRIDHIVWLSRLETIEANIASLEAITGATLGRTAQAERGALICADWSAGLEVVAPLSPRGMNAPAGTTGQAREPLADKLARSGGVLCPPPGVDPEIRAPTPGAGNTPVIPPPGSPGGNPDVRPK